MINPNRLYYTGVITKTHCKNTYMDLYDLTDKYQSEELIQAWVQWSITLDRPIVRKTRRAPKKRN